VTKATDDWINCLKKTKTIIETMGMFKKPADLGFLTQMVVDASAACNEVCKKDFKAPRWPMQAIRDTFGFFMWVTLENENTLQDHADSTYDQGDFGITKTLMTGGDKDKAWAEAFKELVSSFRAFLKGQSEEGILKWTGTQDSAGAAGFFGSGSPAPSQAAAPKEE